MGLISESVLPDILPDIPFLKPFGGLAGLLAGLMIAGGIIALVIIFWRAFRR